MNINIKTNLTGTDKHKRRNPAALALVMVGFLGSLGVANTAQAVTVYQTGFESLQFVVNQPLVGQDGWTGAVPAPPFSLNPEFAIITDAFFRRGDQSVEVRGADLISSGGPTAPYDAVGSYRKPLNNYTIVGKNTLVRVDADMQLATNQPKKTSDDFFGFTITLRDGNGVALGEIGLFSNGKALAYPTTKVVGEVTPEVFSRFIRFNKWYHVTIFMDTANDTTSYFIDDHFIGAIQASSIPRAPGNPNDPPNPDRSNILDRGAMVVYARPDRVGNARANYTARLDNFRISVHSAAPEID
jgi:hypothetical protein